MRPMVSRSTFSWDHKGEIEETTSRRQARRMKFFMMRGSWEKTERWIISAWLRDASVYVNRLQIFNTGDTWVRGVLLRLIFLLQAFPPLRLPVARYSVIRIEC